MSAVAKLERLEAELAAEERLSDHWRRIWAERVRRWSNSVFSFFMMLMWIPLGLLKGIIWGVLKVFGLLIDGLVEGLLLKAYGDRMYTTQVRLFCRTAAVLLVATFYVEYHCWKWLFTPMFEHHAEMSTGQAQVIAGRFALAFAGLIVLLDRLIIVSDTYGKGIIKAGIIFCARAGVIILAARVLAEPATHAVMAGPIAVHHTAAVNDVRKQAVTQATAKIRQSYGEQIAAADARTQTAQSIKVKSAAGTHQREKFAANACLRCVGRGNCADRKYRSYGCMIPGKGVSKRVARDAANARIAAANAAIAADAVSARAQQTAHAKSVNDENNEHVRRLEAERAEDIEALGEMYTIEIITEYGLGLAIPVNDFAFRYLAVREIVKTQPIYKPLVDNSHWIFIFFGVGLLIAKLLCNLVARLYYSLRAQAQAEEDGLSYEPVEEGEEQATPGQLVSLIDRLPKRKGGLSSMMGWLSKPGGNSARAA